MKKSLAIFFILISLLSFNSSFGQNGINVPGGTGNYISIPSTTNNSFNGSTAITVEAWVYFTSTARGGGIVCKGIGGSGESYCLDIFWESSQTNSLAKARFFVRDASSPEAFTASSNEYFTFDKWHHIAGVYDGAQVKIYLDGVLTTGQSMTTAIKGNSNIVSIGSREVSGSYSLSCTGKIDEVRIWNTARSESDILSNMLNEIPNSSYPTGLVSYYKLGTLDDEISNNDGTLVGSFGTSPYSYSAFRGLFTTDAAGEWNTNTNWSYDWSPNSLAPALRKFVDVKIEHSMTLTSDQNINGLTLNGGNINTGSYVITVGRSTSNTGSVTVNSGYVNGNLGRWIGTTAQTYIFPLGGANYYRPVSITYTTAPTTGGTLTAKHFETDPGNNGHLTPIVDNLTYTINAYSDDMYWDITNSGIIGGTYNISMEAPFIEGLGLTLAKKEKLRILKRANSSSDWTVDGTHDNATEITNGMKIYRNGLSSFSQFGIGSNDQDNPLQGGLPISLSAFNYSVIGKDIKLSWSTSEEINNSGFDVERKSVSSDWQKVGFVQGNNKPSQYEFTERNLTTGKYQYRLKQIDFNGNFEYHNLDGYVEVGIPAKFDLSQNYPNPFNPVTNISYQVASSGVVKITVYDMLGKEVKTLVNEFKEPGYYNMNFDAANLNSGVYFYRMNAREFSSVKKLVLIK